MYNLSGQTGAFETDNIILWSYVLQKFFYFPAFITKLDDSRNSSWNSTHVYGHIDPVSSFKNTSRKISVGFDIVGFDLEQAAKNFVNIRVLQQGLYPIYQKNDLKTKSQNLVVETASPEFSYVLSTPPIFEVKYANLISSPASTSFTVVPNSLIVTINSINFSPVLESGYYFDNETDGIFPKLYKLNLNFDIIHHYPLGFVINNAKEIKHRYDVNLNQVDESVNDAINTNQVLGEDVGLEEIPYSNTA